MDITSQKDLIVCFKNNIHKIFYDSGTSKTESVSPILEEPLEYDSVKLFP